MCGIVGYTGPREAVPIVLNGLKRLEYRGYDSAGVAVVSNGKAKTRLSVKRSEGRLENLRNVLTNDPVKGSLSIGHTRWATHGRPSKKNAHPHRYKDVVIVHNGIIENFKALQKDLEKKGHHFKSDTDSEVIAHLLHRLIQGSDSFEAACQKLVQELEGAFAFVAIYTKEKEKLFIAKKDCPMVLGLGEGEQFVASDVAAILEHTKDFIFLEDREMAFVEPSSFVLKTFDGKPVQRESKRINWTLSMAEKDGFDHFMLKEMFEQPKTLTETIRPRVKDGNTDIYFESLDWSRSQWRSFKHLYLTACGTAWHAGLIGKYWIEEFARIHTEVDLASEFRYRRPVIEPKALGIAISQSGETADTIAAMDEAIRGKVVPLSITNTVDSSIVRKTKNVIYTHAGIEIAVASTKCFMAQLAVLALIAGKLAYARGEKSESWLKKYLKDLQDLPHQVEKVLEKRESIEAIAKDFVSFDQYFYLGRGVNYPIALEGALKIKEIAYINTQAYPAGEMKHGPIALISKKWPVVSIAPEDHQIEKMRSNMEEVKSRGGRLITIGTEGSNDLKKMSDRFVGVPEVRPAFYPFLTVVVTQLLAYYMAVHRGCDVDKPRNLAKSVTVE